MTLEELGARIASFALGAMGVLGAHRVHKHRKAARNDAEHPLFPTEPTMEDRVSALETTVRGIVRDMEDRDRRAEQERLDLLAALERVGERIKKSVDEVVDRVDTVVKRVNRLYDEGEA